MKLSECGEYPLRSLLNLGIAAEVGRPIVRETKLSHAAGIPIKFLGQGIQQLREGGFAQSVWGKYGGYRLAKPEAKIMIGSVVRSIDSPLAPIGCVSRTAYEPCDCPDEAHCGLRMRILDVCNAIDAILDRYT